jgi:hypothetical protein
VSTSQLRFIDMFLRPLLEQVRLRMRHGLSMSMAACGLFSTPPACTVCCLVLLVDVQRRGAVQYPQSQIRVGPSMVLQMRGVLGEALRLQLLRRLGETEEHWRRHQARVAAGADPLGP